MLPAPAADTLEFDTGMLSANGIDARAARYFARAPRFAPGIAPVRLTVNGRQAGRADARFDDDGNLCVTPALLRAAGLVVPPALLDPTATASESGGCYDYRHAYPQTIVTPRPGDGAVDLVVPRDALDTARSPLAFDTGGFAALVNYDLLAITTRSPARTSRYWQAATEAGFNAAGWIVRSRQVATSVDGRIDVDHQAAYAQRTFASIGTVLQLGQIAPRSTLFSIGPLLGAQAFPDDALAAPSCATALVTGIARTQARVEVRQLGALIHASQLPAGPFALRDLPLVSGNADLDVTIVEATGETQRFVVPGSSLSGTGFTAANGLSIAAGRLQGYGDAQAPWLATASHGWRVGTRARLSAGALLSAPYQAVATGAELAPLPGLHAATGVNVSRAAGRGGAQLLVALASDGSDSLTAHASYAQRTSGYRELDEAVRPPDLFAPPARTQITAGAGWRHRVPGAFSLDYTRIGLFDGSGTQRISGSWSRQFGQASVSLNVSRNLGDRVPGGTQVYVSMTLPIGKRSVSAFANVADGSVRSGARYADTFGRTGHYSVAADYDGATRSPSLRATLGATPRFARTSLTAGVYGDGRSTLGVTLSGGGALFGGTAVLSPYAISDTFALATVNHQPVVELSTPSGPVWTDSRGHAVVASLPAYVRTRVMVNTKSLPRSIDLKNGVQTIDAGRGSVGRVEFAVDRTRRVLLTVTRANGERLPKLSNVLDDRDRFVTVTADDGKLLLADGQLTTPLQIELPDGSHCRLNFALPAQPPSGGRFYERADARCESLTGAVANGM
ncbi:fimbria/pilus outer membrane usher protein [Burkholderia lata]|uniref:fimbria/pilus outer membrane usher protein n=1 Tax=Burkholderia lata (strain ATCC 17760 / DSM 23089 / LMG 22485 / NCIMB 9086 / R18194 / 383) TaxID=482957 RepID=UPI00399AC4DF